MIICMPSPIARTMAGSAGLPTDSYSSVRRSAWIAGTVRIAEEQAAPALAMERLPVALALREAIGDGVPRQGIHSHADVARGDLDALRLALRLLDAARPRHDAVAAAEERGRGNRRRFAHALDRVEIVERMPARQFIDAPCVVRARIAGKGRGEGDHAAHIVGRQLRDLARVDPAQAPADEAHLATRRAPDLPHALEASLEHSAARAQVEAQLPAVRAVATLPEERAQRNLAHY